MRITLAAFILLITSIVTPVLGEIVKLKCITVEQNEMEKKINIFRLLELDTIKKTARYSNWPSVKVMKWNSQQIVWSNTGDNASIIAVYDIAKDLLLVEGITIISFNPNAYRLKRDSRPAACRRSTF